MIIIAESGATKTDWVVLKNGVSENYFATAGFNPNYFSPDVLKNSILEVSKNIEVSETAKIFFYGSGCSSVGSKQIVSGIISEVFKNTTIEIYTDLFGAARALFGHGKGIAAVLGTGSSSCLFADGKIIDTVPSLGYLFADEGSGFQIGKKLIKASFSRGFPDHLQQLFNKEYPFGLSEILTKVYSDPKPNSVIAGFAPFAVKYRNEPFIKDLVKSAFEDFFTGNILKYSNYQNYNLGFVGSVAFLFEEELTWVAEKFGLKIEKIIKNPIGALVKFHLEENKA